MTATWSVAHHAGCCDGDVDALIDDDTGAILQTRCPQCGREQVMPLCEVCGLNVDPRSDACSNCG